MEELISVILPIYNVAAYLPACLDSILAQTSPSAYEVILVDDGSPDGSGAICDAYASRDNRFRVLHTPNGGVSGARNTGLAAAQGAYVLFCDPDDLLSPELLAVLDPLLAGEPDLLVHGARSFDTKGQYQDILPPRLSHGASGEAYLHTLLELGESPLVPVWTYCYRRAFLERTGLRFRRDLTVAEDLDFNMDCLLAAASVEGTDRVLYDYRLYEASVSKRPSIQKTADRLTIHGKWARRFPCAHLANTYCMHLFNVSCLGTRAEIRPLTEIYRQNRDILRYVSGGKARFARAAFRLLGLYHGSVLIVALIRIRHRVKGIS